MTSSLKTDNPYGLFIPCKREHRTSFQLRIDLIEKFNLFNIKQICDVFNPPESKSTSKEYHKIKLKILSTALSFENSFDELDTVTLYAAMAYNSLQKKDSIVLKVSPILQTLKNNDSHLSESDFNNKHKALIASEYENLKNRAHIIQNVDFPRMRARLALIEFAGFLYPEKIIPLLVSLSLKYLSCEFIQQWILKMKVDYLNNSKEKNHQSLKNLNMLCNSIYGNKNTRGRQYDYWKIMNHYYSLANTIEIIRKNKKNKTLNSSNLNKFYEDYKIPSEYKNLIFSVRSIKNLASEILIFQGHIEGSNTLKEFQSFITKLQKKHFQLKLQGHEQNTIPYLMPFLDFPGKEPHDILKYDLFSQLQHIEIT